MTWSSALNWLKGRENEIQAPDEKEEEKHVLPPSPHTDKPRAPHFSFRLNPPFVSSWAETGPGHCPSPSPQPGPGPL